MTVAKGGFVKKGTQSKNTVKSMLDQTEKIDRREFIATAGKVIIPTLGILGLSLMGFSGKAAAGSCEGTCASGCFGCTGGCAGECNTTCRDICANSCTVGCSSNSQ